MIALELIAKEKKEKTGKLDFSWIRLENLPDEISDLYWLQTLYLRGNQISDISFLGNLTGLFALDLSYNEISDISFLKTLIVEKGLDINWENFGTGIIIENNPLTAPPPEIIKRGREAVLNWFSQREKVKLYESKLLIVGQGEVGKTWLMNRIVTGKTPEDGKTTEGIEINRWEFDAENIRNFRINFWDFGGQEIYHATHQFFLSKRSLYLFVWDARKDEDRITSFDYWLNVISLLSNNSPVIIVMNKCDERSKAIGQDTLKAKFKNIISFHEVSAKTGQGIELLKEDLKKHILQLPQIGDKLPKVWTDIRSELESLGQSIIKNKEYKAICAKFGQNEKEADFLSDYFHDLGIFLHFRNNHILNDIVFLKPDWATNAVYKIIDTKEVIKNSGKFNFNELKTIWKEYDEDKYIYLIELMKKFELCFQIGESNNFIVPELLKPEFSGLDWDYSYNIRFEYKYTFMPAGIITRFIARQHKKIKDEIYWRNGVIIQRNSTKALIVSEPLNRKIDIWINGNEAKEFLFYIRSDIEEIHSTLNNPDVKKMYPCNCDECAVSSEPHFFDSEMLFKFKYEKKLEVVQCQKSGLHVNIDRLRGDMMLKKDVALEKVFEIVANNEEKLNEIILILQKKIANNQSDKDTALDEFFSIVKLDFGIIDFGELLKRVLKYKKRSFI